MLVTIQDDENDWHAINFRAVRSINLAERSCEVQLTFLNDTPSLTLSFSSNERALSALMLLSVQRLNGHVGRDDIDDDLEREGEY